MEIKSNYHKINYWRVHLCLVILAVLLVTGWHRCAHAQPLWQGVITQRGHMRHMSTTLAKRLVTEAKKAAPKWLPPWLLLGLAANESDFRPWLKRGLDCGICQSRVNLWSKTKRGQKKLCHKLSTDTAMSFRYAVDELSRYKQRYCTRRFGVKNKYQFWRCLLQTYREGPFYSRLRKCNDKRCRVRSSYHLRVMCFGYAVRENKKTYCRRSWNRQKKTYKKFWDLRKSKERIITDGTKKTSKRAG